MSGISRSARVLVVAPAAGAPEAGAGAVIGSGSAQAEFVAALRGLSGGVQLEVVSDLETARAALSTSGQGPADAWVADEALGPDLVGLVAAVSVSGGPPCVAVARSSGDAFALAVFRAGAAACVAWPLDTDNALGAAVEAQLDRTRRLHERLEATRGRDRGHRSTRDGFAREVVEALSSALWVVDPNGSIRFANPAAASIVGLPANEFVGLPVTRFFPEVPPAEVPIVRTLEGRERSSGAEIMLTRDDARRVPIGLSCAPLASVDGSPGGAVVIFQDLTEIKQLERQSLQAEKMASIAQLAAGVAHEINNPMGFIHANLCQLIEYVGDLSRVWEQVQALRKTVGTPRPDADAARAAARALDEVVEEVDAAFLFDDLGKAIRESLEGAERVRTIVQDLRAFSHQDARERGAMDVNKALDSTANIVWTMMRHSVRLVKEYGELPPVSGFPVLLKQVFMNLMLNAYQAIEARAEHDIGHRGEIRLRTEVADGGVRITVTDNGTGIRSDVQPRIFDPFFTTREVGVGKGLGLSTSFNLVERHGGTLVAESELGTGSSFVIWLPLEEPSRPETPS